MSAAGRLAYILRIGHYHRVNGGAWLTKAQADRARRKNPRQHAARQAVLAADRERRAR